MDDKPTNRSGGAVVALVLVAVLVVLPALYVLSIGPMARLDHAGALPDSWEGALEVLYSPLVWTANNVPGCDAVLGRYLMLWLPADAFVPPSASTPTPAPAPTPPATASS